MPLAAAAPAEPGAGFFMIANTLYPVLGTKCSRSCSPASAAPWRHTSFTGPRIGVDPGSGVDSVHPSTPNPPANLDQPGKCDGWGQCSGVCRATRDRAFQVGDKSVRDL